MELFRSEKKLLNQMSDWMKKKHQLRLIELEESVLLSQVIHLASLSQFRLTEMISGIQ